MNKTRASEASMSERSSLGTGSATVEGISDRSRWFGIGGSLMFGLCVAYLDRTTLSVGLGEISKEFGFSGENFAVTASTALTIFLVGYALSNILGGIITRRLDPRRVAVWTFGVWSASTVFAGFTHSLLVLLGCRLTLGIAEGIYWPQQSRFANSWFAPHERTKANAVIQYYGTYIALAFGFIILTPINDYFGWRAMFLSMGAIGICVVVPLYLKNLPPQSRAPFADNRGLLDRRSKLTLEAFGGYPFILLNFCYIAQGMLFWGITLWVPLAVESVGFHGMSKALASSAPYLVAVLLAIPITLISDRTGRRVLIASLGLLIPGVLLTLLPQATSAYGKLSLITLALGIFASCFTPNIWSILQATIDSDVIGPAAGIMNGIGAGGGGTIAGFVVGLLYKSTHSYMPGFIFLGVVSVLGAVALAWYGHLARKKVRIRGA